LADGNSPHTPPHPHTPPSLVQAFTEESLEFMGRLLAQSEIGDATYWPPWTVRALRDPTTEYDDSIEHAREEARTVIGSALRGLEKRARVSWKDVDFLIVNCSLFSPTPSLAAMVANDFGLRPDVRTYNLSGQGCSASVLAVDLAKHLLDARPNSTAVIVSTENLTQNLYIGEDRSMLLQNMLFRCGGAAILLSNKPADGFRAKYKLLHTVRTQVVGSEAYDAVYETQDAQGLRGVRLSKHLVSSVGVGLKHNLINMGPYALSLREQVATVFVQGLRYAVRSLHDALAAPTMPAVCQQWAEALPKIEPYVPSFLSGVRHFAIHAGGRKVIDGVEKNLRLPSECTAPSRAALYNFGNTSSSSIWYELKFIEQEEDRWVAKGSGAPIVAGERVLQIAFGSGLKVNSALWLRLR
jgi:predicted naringenin-chalcone synthase